MVLGKKASEIVSRIIPDCEKNSNKFYLAECVFIFPFIIVGIFMLIPSLIIEYLQRQRSRKFSYNLLGHRWLKISGFLYSPKTQKEIFEPIVADWQEEYFEALNKKEIWKSRWINVRYTYAFLGAMWQKSPLGNLLEFISKIAK